MELIIKFFNIFTDQSGTLFSTPDVSTPGSSKKLIPSLLQPTAVQYKMSYIRDRHRSNVTNCAKSPAPQESMSKNKSDHQKYSYYASDTRFSASFAAFRFYDFRITHWFFIFFTNIFSYNIMRPRVSAHYYSLRLNAYDIIRIYQNRGDDR